MAKIRKTDMPVPVYSARAAQIITAWLKWKNHDAVADRDEYGKAHLVDGKQYWSVPSPTAIFERMLSLTMRTDVSSNTVRTRAEDEREFDMAGFKATAKEMNLLACIELKKYPVESLKRWFGTDSYEKMIGKPLDPLKAVKRRIFLAKVDKLREEMMDAEEALDQEFNRQYQIIDRKHKEDVSVSNKAFRDEIAKIVLEFEAENSGN